ncbi:uncharacterized mitochondrial protein AtMg00820-like, partial [Rana temporaria]|uniref:uncharacterized mitochondrial protein AtMg00820-like n=1 Tax=Rana temporaria TaxID=8407 RepID=UPI001AADFF5A
MTTVEARIQEKTDIDQPISVTSEQTVEVSIDATSTEEQTQEGSDTKIRRSTRENKGKPPIRLSYKASTASINEPVKWEDISQLSEQEATKWIKAAEEELKSMHDTKTWTLTELPPGRKAIGCKWTFKVKYNADGTIERYKARLVAKGYSQKYGA